MRRSLKLLSGYGYPMKFPLLSQASLHLRMVTFYLTMLSQLFTCLASVHDFLLSKKEVQDIFKCQQSVIEKNWDNVCDEAQLSTAEKKLFWQRQFLNPFSLR